ncbi:MAG: LptF/LptG family permease [Planctomycetaceae bacterium]|nr:LptF/LptG family permease [Planctomycetaceae bacterium]
MTTYDRYLLFRYFHVVVIFFTAGVGLFAVVDGFTNLDNFQHATRGEGTLALIQFMGKHYGFQSLLIVDLAGPTIMVISAMSTLVLMLRQGEIHPVLAAGIPTYRLTFPLAMGVLLVNGMLTINQEFVLPAVAPQLQRHHGDRDDEAQPVQPQYDPKYWIFVDGSGVYTKTRVMTDPEFEIPAPTLANDYLTLKAEKARFVAETAQFPAGWLLENVSTPIPKFALTEAGQKVIIPHTNGKDVFVASSLSFDRVCKKGSNIRLVGTPELFRRLQQPTGSQIARRSMLVHLHDRLTRPLLTMIGLYIVIPMIVRKERMSTLQQVANIASCTGMLGLTYALGLGSQTLGQAGILSPETAVWAPLIVWGSLSAWLSGIVRT